MEIKNTVMRQGKTNFNMCGQSLGCSLHDDPDQEISHGLVKRLIQYTEKRLIEDGLQGAVKGWEVEVFTSGGNDAPPDRYYVVTFKNKQGISISLNGIMTRKGWPFLDHSWDIN